MLGSLGDKLCLCDWVSEKRKEKNRQADAEYAACRL